MVTFLLSLKANSLCYFQRIDNNEFRAVIERFHSKDNTAEEIEAELDEVLGPFIMELMSLNEVDIQR